MVLRRRTAEFSKVSALADVGYITTRHSAFAEKCCRPFDLSAPAEIADKLAVQQLSIEVELQI